MAGLDAHFYLIASNVIVSFGMFLCGILAMYAYRLTRKTDRRWSWVFVVSGAMVLVAINALGIMLFISTLRHAYTLSQAYDPHFHIGYVVAGGILAFGFVLLAFSAYMASREHKNRQRKQQVLLLEKERLGRNLSSASLVPPVPPAPPAAAVVVEIGVQATTEQQSVFTQTGKRANFSVPPAPKPKPKPLKHTLAIEHKTHFVQVSGRPQPDFLYVAT